MNGSRLSISPIMPCTILLAQDEAQNELSCKDRVGSASVVRTGVGLPVLPPTYSTSTC